MIAITFDDYKGNLATVYFLWGDYSIVTTGTLSMISHDGNTFAEIEITKWKSFYEIQADIIPNTAGCNSYFNLTSAEYDEYCDTERELCDWLRSLSYQYNMILIKPN